MLTVSSAAATTALTTLDAVKTEFDISDSSEDAYLESQIDRVSARICAYLDVTVADDGTKNLGRETLVETVRLPGRGVAWAWGTGAQNGRRAEVVLARRPVVSVASVIEDGTTLASTDYEYDPMSGKLYRLTTDDVRRDWYSSKVVVTYTAGWLLPDDTGRTLPQDIEDAAIEWVKAKRFSRARDPLIKSESTAGVDSVTYSSGSAGDYDDVPAEVAAKLAPYRNISV